MHLIGKADLILLTEGILTEIERERERERVGPASGSIICDGRCHKPPVRSLHMGIAHRVILNYNAGPWHIVHVILLNYNTDTSHCLCDPSQVHLWFMTYYPCCPPQLQHWYMTLSMSSFSTTTLVYDIVFVILLNYNTGIWHCLCHLSQLQHWYVTLPKWSFSNTTLLCDKMFIDPSQLKHW